MTKTLILLTSSYPFGRGEPFVADEMPYLASAFQRIIVVSNDTSGPLVHELPPSATRVRRSYELGAGSKAASVAGVFSPSVHEELRLVRDRYRIQVGRRVLATALVSWRKAHVFARLIRDLAHGVPDGEVHAYSHWANDMALAAAVARKKGWVHRAYCRAHGWDVYMNRTGYLPFRDYLARHLDHLVFVSEDGRDHFESLLGMSYASLSVARLGTPPSFPGPVGRPRPFTVLSCSGMIPLKRVDLIARALHLVASEVRWVHAGDGPARAEVEAACRGLPSRVQVELRGALPHAAVMRLYPEVRPALFLNVSMTEGIPVSMMEALSAGVPVMGTEVGGVRELVEPGANGVLLPSDPTPGDLGAALDRFAALPEAEHARLARGAWATWDEHFNAERNYPAFLRLVRS